MKILFIFGTRPEAIKMAPIIREFRNSGRAETTVCITAQHRQMLDQVLAFFEITPDYDLNIMRPNQTLADLTSDGLKKLDSVLERVGPDIIFIQGDTTTAFVGALAGFYRKIRVAHIEAGLRSYRKYSPFPEEINRTLISRLCDSHFCPTIAAADNLVSEGIKENIWVVGNSVIDALHLGLDLIKEKGEASYYDFFPYLDFSRKIILVTGHRRESFGKPFENVCTALKTISERFSDTDIVYPVHLNPNVRDPVNRILGGRERIHLIEPLDYPHFIWLMSKSHMIITDSGGIQEEAPSLGKPAVVTRDVTERIEGIESGTAKLVGTRRERIEAEVGRLLKDRAEYAKMSQANNPYGDGKTSARIFNLVLNRTPDNRSEGHYSRRNVVVHQGFHP